MSLKRRLGFASTRSFTLTSIFAGALFLFSTLQFPYIDIDRVFCADVPWAVPGECYWFKRPGLMRNGLFLHLVTFLPAGALVCFQFIPVLQRPNTSLLKAIIAIRQGKIREHRAWMLRGWFYNLAQEALVTTNWDLNDLPGITAALRIGYAVGGWVAFAIHSVGIEVHIRKTSPQYKFKTI
ncbi:hypothetical protein FPSE_11054 [Fusarium pseudograminearum CS3096]|uniref:Uncharacterized protein n=1 Tax=Fusarium pseudograminearum (strain CS3096) TaxID=1028729 RepID=K3UBK4_FUSPC|nr:hypothetical protein FPSE_11054 [Fusarium pseudograminearum CS3096]EKJ68786.1 hypothetical protein FPSE_11054 [Fusarium pseudograminearum CS3096]